MPITKPGQAELDGLLLGPGSPYAIASLSAHGTPPVRTSGYMRPQDDGEIAGPDFYEGRQVLGEVSLRDGTPAGDLGDVADALTAAFRARRTGTVPFDYWRPGDAGPRRLFVRPRRMLLEVDYWWHHGIGDPVPIEMFAPDPRWYSTALQSVTLEVPTATTGRTYDRTYPMTYGGGSGGTQRATNTGRVDTHPVTTITGPITNPRVSNATTDEALEFGIELADGETLVVDHYAHTVMLGGTASRYGTLRRPVAWWTLVPGDNDLQLGADSAGVGAQALVEWRHADL